MEDKNVSKSAGDMTFEQVLDFGPPCKACSECDGFLKGNPSTSCQKCGHTWQQHV